MRLSLSIALAVCATALASRHALADDAIVGRVRHAEDEALEACLDAAARVKVGDRLVAVHHAIVDAIAPPGTPACAVGSAEIIGIEGDGHCAIARLTHGNAAALAWISPAR